MLTAASLYTVPGLPGSRISRGKDREEGWLVGEASARNGGPGNNLTPATSPDVGDMKLERYMATRNLNYKRVQSPHLKVKN